MYFEAECVMALKESKVDFVINRKRVCNFLLIINTNFGPILPQFQRYCTFSAENSDHTLFHPNFRDVPFELDRQR